MSVNRGPDQQHIPETYILGASPRRRVSRVGLFALGTLVDPERGARVGISNPSLCKPPSLGLVFLIAIATSYSESLFLSSFCVLRGARHFHRIGPSRAMV